MNQRLKKTLFNAFIHFSIAWILIILFSLIPYLYRVSIDGYFIFNTDGSPVTAWQYIQFSLPRVFLIPFFFLVEFNYQYLFRKTHLLRFALICVLIATFSFLLTVLFSGKYLETRYILEGVEPIVIGGAYAFLYALVRDYIYQFLNRKTLLQQQTENELNALKAQLNPHFLFNTLNYLYGNALKEGAPITAKGVDKLSEMMRYTIMGMHQNFVPLKKEFEFIENYLSLQRVRLPLLDSISLDIQIKSSQRNLEIAPLLLLPFIENAFKYGISLDQPCSIRMEIEEKDGSLMMSIHNSIIKNHVEVKGNNTGIANTIKRLNLLYPNQYKLEYGDKGSEYKVLLFIDLNKTNK